MFCKSHLESRYRTSHPCPSCDRRLAASRICSHSFGDVVTSGLLLPSASLLGCALEPSRFVISGRDSRNRNLRFEKRILIARWRSMIPALNTMKPIQMSRKSGSNSPFRKSTTTPNPRRKASPCHPLQMNFPCSSVVNCGHSFQPVKIVP